jgi:hypothetical protein
MRKDEYKKHPLYKVLHLYSEELQDFIEKKQERHALMKAAAEQINLGPGAHYNPITGTFIRTS